MEIRSLAPKRRQRLADVPRLALGKQGRFAYASSFSVELIPICKKYMKSRIARVSGLFHRSGNQRRL